MSQHAGMSCRGSHVTSHAERTRLHLGSERARELELVEDVGGGALGEPWRDLPGQQHGEDQLVAALGDLVRVRVRVRVRVGVRVRVKG